MFQYGSNINGYDTTYAAKQNLYKFGVRTNVGKQSCTLFHRYRYLERPSLYNKRLKHFRITQITQTLCTVKDRNKIIY